MAARVSITELRGRLADSVERASAGEEVVAASCSRPVARRTAVVDRRAQAREGRTDLRRRARVGDVLTPIDARWEAEGDPA